MMHPKYLFIMDLCLKDGGTDCQISLDLVTRVHMAISRFLIWPVRATDE